MSKAKIGMFFSFTVFMVALISQMLISNMYAVKGQELNQLEQKKSELEKEISKLQLEETRVTSIAYLETQARLKGFTELKSSLVAIRPASFASLPRL